MLGSRALARPASTSSLCLRSGCPQPQLRVCSSSRASLRVCPSASCPPAPRRSLHQLSASVEAAPAAEPDTAEYAEEEAAEVLPLPDVFYQPVLDIKERKVHKQKAETLASRKQLMRMTIGQNGVTRTVLAAAMDILCKHELLRVKLGEGAGLSRAEAAELLAKHLDASVVHLIGFTVTLYRQHGLPRPSNCILQPSTAAQGDASTAA